MSDGLNLVLAISLVLPLAGVGGIEAFRVMDGTTLTNADDHPTRLVNDPALGAERSRV